MPWDGAPMKTRVALVGIAIVAAVLSVGMTGGASASHLYPAYSAEPTAGFCDTEAGRVVTVVVYDDSSALRCYQMRKSQRLRFVNRGQHAMRLEAPFLQRFWLQPGQSRTIKAHVGSYLAPGAHKVGSSEWCCFGFDIFLPGAPTPTPTGAAG